MQHLLHACKRIWTSVSRVDSVSTLTSCNTTPSTTKFISPYDAIATPIVTTTWRRQNRSLLGERYIRAAPGE